MRVGSNLDSMHVEHAVCCMLLRLVGRAANIIAELSEW